jgi:hypothetical protein
MSDPTPEDKKLTEQAAKVTEQVCKMVGYRPPVKPVEQQLAEWVTDAITFDAGGGMKVITREEFTNIVKIVPFPPQQLLGYSRLFDITIDTIPGINIAGEQLPAKLRFDVEIRMG